MRRIFYLLLLMALSFTASAQQLFWYQGLCYRVINNNSAEVVSREYNYGGYNEENYSGSITIPSVVTAMVGFYESYKASYVITSIAEDAFKNCTDLTDIEIPNTVTSIGEYAFSGCVRLTELNLPGNLDYIGDQAFSGCTGLTRVVIPNSVRTLGWNAFYGCSSLTDVTLSQSLRQLGGTFAGCTSLTSVEIPRSVTVLDGTFTGCSVLTSVDITGSLRTIGERTFDGCSSLTGIYIPNSVTSIGKLAFSNTALTSIEIPASMKKLGEDAFYGCDQLMAITCRPVNPPVMTNQGCFADDVYSMATLTVPAAGLDSYLGTDWWNLFDAENVMGNATLNKAYDFKVGGLCYIITGNTTVSVTSLDGGQYSGDVTVPATVSYMGRTYQVTGIGVDAFNGCTGLTSITLPSSLTQVGARAFKGCYYLPSFSFPESLVAIGDSAFQGCHGFTSLVIPGALTTLGEGAFTSMSNLTSLAWNARNCYTNGGLNLTSGRLATVTIGEGVQTLPRNFVAGAPITSIDFPSSLTTIGYGAFWGCNKLASLVIPEGIQYIGSYAFTSCSSLTSLTWNARECWTNGDMYTSKLSELTIGEQVEVLPPKLACGALIPAIDIPESVKFIGASAFQNCLNVPEIVIPDQVEIIGLNAFLGCENATNIVIGKGVEAISEAAFALCDGVTSLTWNAICCRTQGDMPTWQLEHLTIGHGVTLLPRGLASNSKITELSIPNTVKIIGTDNCHGWGCFQGCDSLTHVELPPSVERIECQSFRGCENLTSISLSDSLVYLGNEVFYDCTKLENVTLFGHLDTIGHSAFSECRALKTLSLPASLTYLGDYAFAYSGLTEVAIPNSMNYLSDMVFYNCADLNRVTLPSELIEISNYLFYNCRSLQNISIPSTVRKIGYHAFASCLSLRHITIPAAVAYIDRYAFNYCPALTSVTFMGPVVPSDENDYYYEYYSGSYMGYGAFYYCNALADVTCMTMEPPKLPGSNAFSSIYETATLHVPEAAVESYRDANVWKLFTNIVGMPGSGPGDVNGDGALDIDDVTVLIGMLLNGEELPAYADVNGDGVADIDDVVQLITMLLNGH